MRFCSFLRDCTHSSEYYIKMSPLLILLMISLCSRIVLFVLSGCNITLRCLLHKHQLEHRKPIFTALTTHTFIVIYLASLQIWAQTFYLPYHATLPLHEKYRKSWNMTSVEILNVLHGCHMCFFYTRIYRETKNIQ